MSLICRSLICPLYVPYMSLICMYVEGHRLFDHDAWSCVLYVPHMSLICTLYVYPLYVPYMSLICPLFVCTWKGIDFLIMRVVCPSYVPYMYLICISLICPLYVPYMSLICMYVEGHRLFDHACLLAHFLCLLLHVLACTRQKQDIRDI